MPSSSSRAGMCPTASLSSVPAYTSQLFGTRRADMPHTPTRSPPASPQYQPAPQAVRNTEGRRAIHATTHHRRGAPPAGVCHMLSRSSRAGTCPPPAPSQYPLAPAGGSEQGEPTCQTSPTALTTALPLGADWLGTRHTHTPASWRSPPTRDIAWIDVHTPIPAAWATPPAYGVVLQQLRCMHKCYTNNNLQYQL